MPGAGPASARRAKGARSFLPPPPSQTTRTETDARRCACGHGEQAAGRAKAACVRRGGGSAVHTCGQHPAAYLAVAEKIALADHAEVGLCRRPMGGNVGVLEGRPGGWGGGRAHLGLANDFTGIVVGQQLAGLEQLPHLLGSTQRGRMNGNRDGGLPRLGVISPKRALLKAQAEVDHGGIRRLGHGEGTCRAASGPSGRPGCRGWGGQIQRSRSWRLVL
jgi:hypothetical protein